MLKILRRFFSFLVFNRPVYLLFIFLIIVSSSLQNFIPYFYKLFINSFTSGNLDKIYYVLFGYIGVRLTSVIFEAFSFMVGDYILKESSSTARITVFKYVQDLDFFFHTNKSTGSLISAFKRGDGAFFDLYHNIHFKIINVVVGFWVLIYFFTQISPLIAISTMVSFVVMLISSILLVKNNLDVRKMFNDEEDNVSGVITDNLINYETVKLFAKEDWERKRLSNIFVAWKKHLWKYGLSFRYIDLSTGFIINTSVFLILSLVISLFKKQAVDLGDVVLVVSFIDLFYPKVSELIWSFRQIGKHYSDIQKYFGLLDQNIEIKDPQKPVFLENINGEINFKNISYSYQEGKKGAINNFDLKIREGQSVALVGRSGSGKTTLIKLLMRFYDVDSGSILIDGVNVKDMNKSYLRSLMGVVPQEPILFNNTISYNIGYGKENATLQEIRAASKMANIDSFIESLPKKYDTNVGERGIKLSGGQKQRLAIARMILSDPDIVIFDEATSHLDSESENLIQEAFWKASKNKTTIVIAHRLSTVIKADRIVVMDNGKIVEEGSHLSLSRNKDSLYSHFWKLQVKE